LDKVNTRRKTSLIKQRRGATAVEMALVAPLFFLFALALIEFSRIALVKQALTDAARAGCREAVLATTLSHEEVESVIRDNLRAILADTHVDSCQVTLSHTDFSNVQRGTEITASIEVDCSDVSWISPRYGDGVMIRAESTMNRE
jgi:Flp pilus assembly protein TadG